MVNMPSSVLVVGDGDKMQQSVALNLKRKGYQHVVAETGQAALDLARQRFFDVAFVDTHLSDTQWVDLPARLKELQPDMEVLLITGYAWRGDLIQPLAGDNHASSGQPQPAGEERTLESQVPEMERLWEEKRRLESQRDAALDTLRRRNDELELLNRITRTFSSMLSLDQLLATVLDETCRALGVVAASVWLIDAATGELVCRQAAGPKSEEVRGWRLAPGQGIAGWVAQHGQSLIVADAYDDQRYFSGVGDATGLELRSILSVPMRASSPGSMAATLEAGVIGVLQAVDISPGRFGTADLSLFESMAASAVIALDNARLFERAQQEISERVRAEEELRRRNRELALFNQIIASSTAGLELETILETACRELAGAFEVPQAAVVLLDEEKSVARVVAEYRAGGRPSGLNRTIPVAGNPSFQYLLSRKVPLIVEDAQSDPRLSAVRELMRDRGTVSLLLLPLIVEDEVVGSLGLDAIQARQFSAEEVNLAWSVAGQVSGALARARLADTQRRLIAAIEQAAEGVMITDVEWTIVYVNPAFEHITGYSQVEVMGQDARMFDSDRREATFYQELQATLESGRSWQGRMASQKRDGTRFTSDATITPVHGKGGRVVNYVVLQRDVTRELQLEEQYHQAQKMQAVGQLTAGIAHDFNNLLTAINGFAELMSFELAVDDPRQELVHETLSSGRRAADLVRQLLAFSHKQLIEPHVLDLNVVVADLEEMLRRIIGENVLLESCLPSDLWPVKLDRAQIEQVIVNLAVNARDAMPSGGRLTIETANVALDEVYAAGHLEIEPGEYVLLAVSDTGVGMSREVQARLFEPFFTTKGMGKGTGLGLATVYGIVKQSSGHIWVYSEEGVGSTFKIYLPRCQEPIKSEIRPRAGREMPRGCETILLAEDDEAIRELARRILEGQGYTLLVAEDGAAALQLAADSCDPIHLLVTDVVMPGISGRLLAEGLGKICPGLKTLYMSGYADEAIGQHQILVAGAAFLQKPFSPLALARKVRQVLDDSHSEDLEGTHPA
jgi:PAS domain S-box-containing protein